MKIYFKLFKETFLISAFTFGGGYVIVPLMQKKFVDDLGYITKDEMLDMVSIAQCSCGAIAVNTSILLGYKIKGVLGSIVCMLGSVLPPFLIISIISFFYSDIKDSFIINNALLGMRACVAAAILIAVYNMIKPLLKNKMNIALIILSLVLAAVFNLNPIIIIFTTIILSSIFLLVRSKK